MMVLPILTACSSSAASGFPTGKFVSVENDREGFVFEEDGTWLAFSGEYTMARGTYQIDGDLYIEESNNGGCEVPMSFRYTYDGTSLKFDLTDQSQKDTCEGRLRGFSGTTYTEAK